MNDPHTILGITAGATKAEIEAAYRRLAMSVHPDRPLGNTQDMAALNQARDIALGKHAAPARVRPPREPCTYSEYLDLHRRNF
jgi:DnaJ-domain-containing protein 1